VPDHACASCTAAKSRRRQDDGVRVNEFRAALIGDLKVLVTGNPARAIDGVTDVAVVGAGPAGCVTALAFARRGARVLLLEANPRASTRLAGEWLHPAGARVLDELGLAPIKAGLAHPAGRGFAIFADDGAAPIVLEYPGGAVGFTCDHGALVSALREAAGGHPNVSYVPFAHVTGLEQQRLTFEREGHPGTTTVRAHQVVGADGRSSVTRRWLGLRESRVAVSCTAGVLLEDAELPLEGFGHLLLHGPGPAFIYRIGPRHVRACLDVPAWSHAPGDHPQYLWRAYGPAMPESLRPAFWRALQTRPVAWASNHFRPRTAYGREGLALVGDAVGQFHPLTAVGLTLGMQDGECLARSSTFEAYRRERAARSHVPEMMARILYEVFALRGGGASALRTATCRMLRRDPAVRQRTMRLLAAEDADVLSFGRPFVTAVVLATERVLWEAAAPQRWPHGMRTLIYLHRRLLWLALHAMIGVLRPWGGPGTVAASSILSEFARRAAPLTVGAAEAAPPPMLVDALSGPKPGS
jgi:2-polyprenyl-6-methoxyphenol hydroxylase-like FAD-dependent oxidoreductase